MNRQTMTKGETTIQRTTSFDTLKAVAAYLVVFLHWETENAVGRSIHLLAYMAVPVFFMISGFFFNRLNERGKVVDQLKKVVRLTLYAYLVYFLLFWYRHKTLAPLADWFTADRLSFYLFSCDVRLGFHLWYLNSIVVVLALLYLFTRRWKLSRLFFLIPPLLLTDWYFTYLNLPPEYNRNILIPGLAFFLLGSWVSGLHVRRRRIHFFLPFLFGALLIVELFLCERWGSGKAFVCLTPLCVSVLLVAQLYPEFGAKTVLPYIGRNLSAYIFVYHIAFVLVFYDIMPRVLDHSFLLPVLTMVCSTVVAWVHVKVKNLLAGGERSL